MTDPVNSVNVGTTFALAQMDALAAKLIERARPIRFAVAHSPEELDGIHRLRCRIALKRKWATQEDLPDGLERDEYDSRAVHIAGWDGDVLAGTSRLILPLPGRPLPTEAITGLEMAPRGRVVDVGRVCVATAYSHASHRVSWGLLSRTWLEMRGRGLTDACGMLTPGGARMYQSWGLRVIRLGASRLYSGEERYPALVRPAQSLHSLIRATSRRAGHPVHARTAPTPDGGFGSSTKQRGFLNHEEG